MNASKAVEEEGERNSKPSDSEDRAPLDKLSLRKSIIFSLLQIIAMQNTDIKVGMKTFNMVKSLTLLTF